MRKAIPFILAVAALLVAASCKKNSTTDSPVITQPGEIQAAPDGFTYATSKVVSVSVRLLTNKNLPVKGVTVSLLRPGTSESNGVLFKAITDLNGYVKGSVIVPSYVDTLIIRPDHPGLINNAKALIVSNTVIATLGGTTGYGGSIVPEKLRTTAAADTRVLGGVVDPNTGIEIAYPDPYKTTAEATVEKSGGVPSYLEKDKDEFSAEALENMDYAFPEGDKDNVSTVHPEYLRANGTSVDLVKSSALYVTFISEGSKCNNSLGFYTYPTGKQPATTAEIGKITMVFPNASEAGSSGGLVTGDKVKIGTFEHGTSVGFVLLQNAWTGSGVAVTAQKFFSTAALNPESREDLKRHSCLLNMKERNLFLFGFEDMNRESKEKNPDKEETDNDFNDVLFCVSSGAVINDKDVPVLTDTDTDKDGDGVKDSEDEYKDDPTKGYTETTEWKTLAFEDLWPATGDYDMNDVVIQYRYTFVKDKDNAIVEFSGDYKVVAAGAVYSDGFGVEFPFEPGLVKQVTGYKFTHDYIKLAANGLEEGQSKAVIIPFDDYHAAINNTGISSPAINTNLNLPKVEGATLHVTVVLAKALSPESLNVKEFNPFLIGNLQRGTEIHLSGRTPTDKADKKLLGTKDDSSDANKGRYYQTGKNWPWAIDIDGVFLHPIENSPINSAYLHFLDWAQSGGSVYADWYSNVDKEYRNTGLIYTK